METVTKISMESVIGKIQSCAKINYPKYLAAAEQCTPRQWKRKKNCLAICQQLMELSDGERDMVKRIYKQVFDFCNETRQDGKPKEPSTVANIRLVYLRSVGGFVGKRGDPEYFAMAISRDLSHCDVTETTRYSNVIGYFD